MAEAPSAFGHRTVTPSDAASFGALTGDYSRIHFDHELGAATPWGRGFAHGLLSASWALGAMTLHTPERLRVGSQDALPSRFAVRFSDVVRFGDTLAIEVASGEPGPGATAFALADQDARVVTTGEVVAGAALAAPTAPWPAQSPAPPPGDAPLGAEELIERGPRGVSRVRTVTEAEVVAFTGFSGELNPLYIDAAFAERARFGQRIAPPMLVFCLGFSAWLRELLRWPLPGDESSAGHLGDRWQLVAPVFFGDTLELRHRPLSLRRTRSRPTHGVATFGLQLVNQHEAVVLVGEVDMMLAMEGAAPD